MAFLAGWTYRKAKTITGTTAGAQTNYQMQLTVYAGVGVDTVSTIYLNNLGSFADFRDLRFTKADGTTLLDYWIESTVAGVSAVVWIEVDTIPASPSTINIYAYYNNPAATAVSNGINTFLFFDDFNRPDSGTIGYGWTLVQGTGGISGNKVLLGDTATLDGYAVNPTSGHVNGFVITSDYYMISAAEMYGGITIRSPTTGLWVLGFGWILINNAVLSIYDNNVAKTSIAKVLTANVWYNTEMIIYPNNAIEVRIWLKTVIRPTLPTISFGTFAPASTGTRVRIIGAGSYSVNHAYYDNLYTRLYTSPEPTWSETVQTTSILLLGDLYQSNQRGISMGSGAGAICGKSRKKLHR